MNEKIQVQGLTKSYGAHAVLKGVDLTVREGEIFALLGVNGAGKTTTLECVEGMRKYDGGHITVRGKMGIQLQSASLPAHIKPKEAVRLFAMWNHARPNTQIAEMLGIPVFENKPYASLSTGQKRRLHLLLALVGDPDILILDEPTAGLDVEGRLALHELIRRLRDGGKTIVLASHDMAEVESLCDRIAVLHEGKIAFAGTQRELTERVGRHYTVTLQTTRGKAQFAAEDIASTLLARLQAIRDAGDSVLDLQIDRGTLEEHFIRLTKGESV